MIDAKREAEQIVRDKGGVCLVPLPGRGGISSHEKTFCDCEVERMLTDAITRAERQGYIRGLRDAADEYCSTIWTQEIALDIRAEADRLEKEHETKNP